MAARLTFKQKTSFVFWLIFTLGSIFCAAQSLYRSTGVEKLICYVGATAILATATLCLTLVKESTSEGYVARRKLKLYAGTLVFFLEWIFIVMANTHYIYFQMSSDRMRLSELNAVKKNFDLTRNTVINQIDSMSANYSTKIDNEIDNLKTEITNPYNPGHATKTDSILKRIEILIGDNADLMTNPPSPSNIAGLRIYADLNADKIRRIRDNNLATCKARKNEIESFFIDTNNIKTFEAIETTIEKFELIDELEKRNILRNSYTLFDKICKAISDISIPLGKNTLIIDIAKYKLAEIPPSIDMEDIATAWKQFFQSPNARFIWSIILALIIDVACFMFWYFGVLSKED